MTQMLTALNSSGHTLDLLFVNDNALTNCSIAEVLEPLVRVDLFHPPLLVTLVCSSPVHYRDDGDNSDFLFARTNFDGLNEAIQRTDWSSIEQTRDIDEAVMIFTATLQQLFSDFVPRSRPRRSPPWSNRYLGVLKRQRAAALRHYSCHRNAYTKREHSIACQQYRNYNRKLYLDFVRRTQNDLKRNPKGFWNFVKSKRNETGLPRFMHSGTESTNSVSNMCEMFASHFANAFLEEHLDSSQINASLLNVPRDAFHISCPVFSASDVVSAIASLKSSCAPGTDGIPAIVFKKCANSLSGPLASIFNKSMNSSTFPEAWKQSIMFPVYKKGDKTDVANYRGITSLCAGSKVLEILVGDALFRSSKHYITVKQHGFFPGRSTTTNLVQFVSSCIKEIEKGGQIDTVYTDLKAAFDRVNHQILLAKLDRLGGSTKFVRWLETYLTNRQLFVKIGKNVSRQFLNPSGVPQGSNLGPLLFAIYFNDVCFALPPDFILIYADDLKLFLLIKSIEDCKELQRLIYIFEAWCSRNRLMISSSKCAVISFTRSKSPILYSYNIVEDSITRMSVVKDLGVLLDCKLTFTDHFSYIVAKANRMLGFIIRLGREFSDPYCLRALYLTYVRSTLESCVVVWCPYTVNWINRLEVIQKRFLRFALRSLPWNDPVNLPSYESRCQLLGINTLAQRRNLLKTMFVAKLLLGEIDAPEILSELNLNVVPRPLRNRHFLRLSFHRTGYGQSEPIRAMCEAFNSHSNLFDFNVSCVIFRNQVIRDL